MQSLHKVSMPIPWGLFSINLLSSVISVMPNHNLITWPKSYLKSWRAALNEADYDNQQCYSHLQNHTCTLTWSSDVFPGAKVWLGLSNRSWVLTFGAASDRPPSSPGLNDISTKPDPSPQFWPEGGRVGWWGTQSQDLQQASCTWKPGAERPVSYIMFLACQTCKQRCSDTVTIIRASQMRG